MSVDFVKGHCGWDIVTLLPEGQIPQEDELHAALKILALPIEGGLEVGWIGRGIQRGEVMLRMVNSTTRDWIPMCGGMTQVIGKAMVETFLRDRFDVDISQSVAHFKLITPAGEIPLRVDVCGNKASRVTTVMDAYLSHVMQSGVESLVLNGVPGLRVGKYVVLDVLALEQRYPGVDFTQRAPGVSLDIVNGILRIYRDRMGFRGVNGMLFDERPEGSGHFRVFPRFYSDDLAAARMPWEFQCGTGSIAVATALAQEGRLPFSAGVGEVRLEWGSYRSIPDPYGIRISQLELGCNGRSLAHAAFSHSVVEILAEGKLTLPGY
jgi:hypothetical protein